MSNSPTCGEADSLDEVDEVKQNKKQEKTYIHRVC